MVLTPVKASGWLSTSLSVDERGVLRQAGIVPVNDKLYPYWGDLSKILILYGGRGGGKSKFVFQKLVKECISSEYFKCFYGRKIFDAVRESCFATLVTVIKEMNLEHEFYFSRTNNGSMVVTHLPTGNKFIPFGADNPDKLKSIEDPTHIFCEEFDQFTFHDFKELYLTLRTKKAKCQFVVAFNTHPVYTDHWIIKVFFSDEYTGNEEINTSVIDGVEVSKCFINYYDNYFIDREQYKKDLMMAAAGNMLLFEGMANGAWGVSENNNPWLYSFDIPKHVVEEIPLKPMYPIYLSFDFNNDPIACTAWQFSTRFGADESFLHCIAEFVGTYKIDQVCQRIRAKFPNSIMYLTGDRSGKNKDVGRNQTLYEMIAAMLNINKKLINAPDSNLEHADSRILCNMMFENYPNLKIDSSCTNLIRDCQIAKVDEKSSNGQQLLKDRDKGYKMDTFDSMRYLKQTYFHEYVKKHYLNLMYKK